MVAKAVHSESVSKATRGKVALLDLSHTTTRWPCNFHSLAMKGVKIVLPRRRRTENEKLYYSLLSHNHLRFQQLAVYTIQLP